MGCDIHGWVEVKQGRKWIGVGELKNKDRNYKRFAALAGVRGAGPKPKGIPPDISDTSEYHIDIYGKDGHSHSYIPLEEAAQIWVDTELSDVSDYDKFNPVDSFISDLDLDKQQARLVFWFDN